MSFSKPQIYKARLSEKHFLSENERYMYLKFELIEPNEVEFRAGQYLNIKVSEKGERRSYSFVNTPDTKHAVEIMAEIFSEGVASKMFKSLTEGDNVEILAPLGRFVVNESSKKGKLLFVGTGSGIVPLYSMINDLLRNKHDKRPMRLHWGLRNEEDIFWMDNLQRLSEEYDNFVFDFVLSKPKEGWDLCFGHVQDCIRRDLGDMSEWEAYVSGNNDMIEDVRRLLLSKGINEDSFYTEQFS